MNMFYRPIGIMIMMLFFSYSVKAQLPNCSPPPNATVICDDLDPSFSVYGQPVLAPSICLDTIVQSINLSQYDTLCHTGLIRRIFTVTDCAGMTGTCAHTILVTANQDYFMHFPPDVVTSTCSPNNQYGNPNIFDASCERVVASSDDIIVTIVPDACYRIVRTWKLYNACTYNPNLPCVYIPNPNPNAILNHPSNLNAPALKVTPYAAGDTTVPVDWRSSLIGLTPGATPTDFSTFYQANANCYQYDQLIKINDSNSPVIDNCPTTSVAFSDITNNDPALWKDTLLRDPLHNTTDLCEGKVDLNITASDVCAGANVNFRYLLFLDTDNNGSMETVVNSQNLPQAGYINIGNASNPNYAGGTPVLFDKRQVAANQRYQFGLSSSIVGQGDKTEVKLRFLNAANPGLFFDAILPHGTHRIRWIVTDNCGNEQTCDYNFTVRDTKPPTVVCLPGISLNIMLTQMIEVWDFEFLQYTIDNCTPDSLMSLSDKTGICVGCTAFPLNAQGNPQKTVTFTCQQLGTQAVRIWSRDGVGNTAYCETSVLILDNLGNCSGNPVSWGYGRIKGRDVQNNRTPVSEVLVNLNLYHPSLPAFTYTTVTNQAGEYNLANGNIVPTMPGTITPSKDGNALTGVDMLDVLKTQRHILGLEPLPNVHRQIAADVNKSRTITSSDIITMRKLILGVISKWPNSNSFRFVDEDYVFPNSNNAFATVFPESISFSAAQFIDSTDFEAIRIGDVNGSSFFAAPADDRFGSIVHLDVNDAEVAIGDETIIQINTSEPISAAQFTLDLYGLEILETDLPQDMFHIHDKGTMTIAADALNAFTIRAKALQSSQLSQMFELSSRITPAVAVTSNLESANVALRFTESSATPNNFLVYQNRPNPFAQTTVLGFYLPKAAKATLNVYDQLGKLVHTQTADFEAGVQSFVLNREQLSSQSGVYLYTISTDGFSATRQFVLID